MILIVYRKILVLLLHDKAFYILFNYYPSHKKKRTH